MMMLHRNLRKSIGFILVLKTYVENKTLIFMGPKQLRKLFKSIGFIHTIAQDTPAHGFDGRDMITLPRRTLATGG